MLFATHHLTVVGDKVGGRGTWVLDLDAAVWAKRCESHRAVRVERIGAVLPDDLAADAAGVGRVGLVAELGLLKEAVVGAVGVSFPSLGVAFPAGLSIPSLHSLCTHNEYERPVFTGYVNDISEGIQNCWRGGRSQYSASHRRGTRNARVVRPSGITRVEVGSGAAMRSAAAHNAAPSRATCTAPNIRSLHARALPFLLTPPVWTAPLPEDQVPRSDVTLLASVRSCARDEPAPRARTMAARETVRIVVVRRCAGGGEGGGEKGEGVEW